MVVCNFFLQGRCRYGEKCWNEHPRGGNRGGGGGYNESYNRSSGQQQFRGGGGGGGFGNRVWVNPSQQRGNYIQPSSFSSQERSDWGSGGGRGGRRENLKSSEFSFSTQNRFSDLGSSNTFDKGGRGGGRAGGAAAGEEDDDKKLEMIQMDVDVWESSGQWGFSCYSCFKAPISGFTDLSPEELRLEYYSARASGDLQSYINGVNQLLSQWKSRVQELKIMNLATRGALLAELNGTAPQSSTGDFGSTTPTVFGLPSSSFGSKDFGTPAPAQANSFSFTASGFGSSAAPSSSAVGFGFGSALAAPTQPPTGFGSSTPSASAFSFAAPDPNKPPASSGFGSASGFSFSSAANTGGGFGTGFDTGAPGTAGGSSALVQTGFGAASSTASAEAGSVRGPLDGLFSAESKLTEEELNQFKAKRFTLGQIPLKPPPANILVV